MLIFHLTLHISFIGKRVHVRSYNIYYPYNVPNSYKNEIILQKTLKILRRRMNIAAHLNDMLMIHQLFVFYQQLRCKRFK